MREIIFSRFDAHIMMGLAHGKVSECTARLALAQGMIKVSSQNSVMLNDQCMTLVFYLQTMKIYSLTDGARNCDLSERVSRL